MDTRLGALLGIVRALPPEADARVVARCAGDLLLAAFEAIGVSEGKMRFWRAELDFTLDLQPALRQTFRLPVFQSRPSMTGVE